MIHEKKIKFGTSLLGCKFPLKMLDGENININIVGQIFNDEIRVIKNKGCIDLRSGQKGDLIIKFEVERCGYLSNSEIENLRTIFEFDNFTISSEMVEEHNALTLTELEQNNNDDGDNFPPGMSGENVQCAQS